jgi:hypothetical protein
MVLIKQHYLLSPISTASHIYDLLLHLLHLFYLSSLLEDLLGSRKQT